LKRFLSFSLVMKNGAINSTQADSYSEILKTSKDPVNLPLLSSKEKHLRSDEALTSSVARHSLSVCQGEQMYTCNLCRQLFFNASTLKLHYEIHLRERAQECNICGKVFHDSYQLKMHIKIHTELKLYANSNKPTFHNNNNGTFDSPHYQKMHSRYPAGYCSYRCKLCNKLFTNANVLKMHVRAHNGNRPHCCVLCSKTFIDEYQFTQHLHLHCEERTYVCRVCNKCFSNIKEFRIHNRIHDKERTYLCKKFFSGH
jgi:KRAB domain-containing zinc finger protein